MQKELSMESAIFKNYTGNAMLNNALMTIEALGNLSNVSCITPSLLAMLFNKYDLKALNRRMKNYTMLFTKNGPLHNDKVNGNKIYVGLFKEIVESFENEGELICEISGLRFSTTFEELFKNTLRKIGLTQREIDKKDTSLSRMWFPLIGGLGSDAQALPQAKYTITIHPICIAILQFLPLSSLLYKGGILLVDSSNFELSRMMIFNNTRILLEKIQTTTSDNPIENVKDFSKGNYLIKTLEILQEKEEMHEDYSDLNLWSFSNSGTGASCEIDRVPNTLIKKLMKLFLIPQISNELKYILSDFGLSSTFIQSLEDNKDWPMLYPTVFGSGKKKKDYDGVSVLFLESYYEVIHRNKLIYYAKYIAGLINKYKSKEFEKFIAKTDAWSKPEYRIEVFRVLSKATEMEEWNLLHHTQILDDNNEIPIKNRFYKLHKLIHFYSQNGVFGSHLPDVEKTDNKVFAVCKNIIGVIQKDIKSTRIISELIKNNDVSNAEYFRMFNDAQEYLNLHFKNILDLFFDDKFNFYKYGLNDLLKLFFIHPKKEDFIIENLDIKPIEEPFITNWINNIESFVNDFKDYYCEKYIHRETGKLPIKKYSNLVRSYLSEQNNFIDLMQESIYNTNQFISKRDNVKADKWNIADLLNDPMGNYNSTLGIAAIKFALKKQSIKLNLNN